VQGCLPATDLWTVVGYPGAATDVAGLYSGLWWPESGYATFSFHLTLTPEEIGVAV